MQAGHGRIDLLMAGGIEILGRQRFHRLGDGIGIQQHAAQDGLLCLDAVRRHALCAAAHGPSSFVTGFPPLQ